MKIKLLILFACFFALSCNINKKNTRKWEFEQPFTNKSGAPLGPGEYSTNLKQKISDKYKRAHKDYEPRTKHLTTRGKAIYTNRFYLETSPYLLQHAHNPVNWFAWGEEAFRASKELNRPIFLSIGYSTCHWCHVMEEESFEDLEIAKYLNQNFIPIKIDREERPDIDSIYMTAVTAMTGSGGWPLNVWLTSDRLPVFGGTYFPPRTGARGQRMGFLETLKQMNKAFKNELPKIDKVGKNFGEYIKKAFQSNTESMKLDDLILDKAFSLAGKKYDKHLGGVNRGPKFPSSFPIRFLLRYDKDPYAKTMALTTLYKMRNGGIYDQVAGGFHRYSTDKFWLIPHFEKMLYDNALLATTYLEGFLAYNDQSLLRTTREILNYIIRDMTSSEGVFYTATDADNLGAHGEREEGSFFTWDLKELKKLLSAQELKVVVAYYGANHTGNFEGRNLFFVDKSLEATAKKLNMSIDKFSKILSSLKEKLYLERDKRNKPLLDDKIILSNNALMISAFAKAGFSLHDSRYTSVAKKAMEFIFKKMYKNQKLFHVYKNNNAKILGFSDDYIFLLAACLDLFHATQEKVWIERAKFLDDELFSHFEDHKHGGFYKTSLLHEKLLAREKDYQDGAIPSANSVAVLNLFKLYELTADKKYLERAEKLIMNLGKVFSRYPLSASELLIALQFQKAHPLEIFLSVPDGLSETQVKLNEFINPLRKLFKRPYVLITGKEKELSSLFPITKGKVSLKNKITAYICENGSCLLPISNLDKYIKALEK